jgi:hypothetical protein
MRKIPASYLARSAHLISDATSLLNNDIAELELITVDCNPPVLFAPGTSVMWSHEEIVCTYRVLLTRNMSAAQTCTVLPGRWKFLATSSASRRVGAQKILSMLFELINSRTTSSLLICTRRSATVL